MVTAVRSLVYECFRRYSMESRRMESSLESGLGSVQQMDGANKLNRYVDSADLMKAKVSDLIPYINNSRTHSDTQVSQIAASIKEFGFLNPVIIDKDNGIIAGHGRIQAAQKLGITEVPVVKAEHLTEAQKKAYIIADNQLALNAGWDIDLLKVEIEGLNELGFNVDLLGFDDEFLQNLTPSFEPGTEDDQGDLSNIEPRMVTCPFCDKSFDTRVNS